jgi:tetratricopeptide (TPR) repeat protein
MLYHFKKIFLKNYQFSYIVLLGWLVIGFCTSCSQHSTGPVGKAYHNLAARDNAFFLARLRMKEAQQTLFNARQEDYNQILPLFVPVDSNKTAGIRTVMDDCIKKSSTAIKWHKNSKWVDDCYLVIGKARFYLIDFPNAIETFKYVNRDESDNDAKHEALNWLLYTFTEKEEYDNAFAVADYIRRQPLNEKNKRDFYLHKAYLHQRKKEYKYTAAILELTLPLMSKGEEKSRTHFILGQLYQKFGKRKEANKHFRAALKKNPPYELAFYTRLNLLQTTDITDQKNVAKAKAYFNKLLKDAKNVDYLDKIYYELALFELGQKKYEPAIENLKKSVSAPSKNSIQKAYSFLQLATIYYDNLQQYSLAKAYYDSTMTSLPKEAPEYPAVAQKQKILDKFVQQLQVIQTEDSLQRLARMDTIALSNYFDEVLAKEEAKQKALEREAARLARSGGGSNLPDIQAANAFGTQQKTGERFYLYNPTALSLGKSDFARKWGTRPLEDNWRRAKKENNANLAEDPNATDANSPPKVINREEELQARKKGFYQNIPFSEEALKASNLKLEEAYYTLGKIYDLELNEPPNAIQTFDTLLVRFPQTTYRPEVLYFLYLIYDRMQDARRSEYEEKLLQDYPNSTFARLIKSSGNVDEMNAADNEAKEAYAQAYALYETGNYDQALKAINQAMTRYPKSAIEEKYVLLKVFITGKTQPLETYRKALNDFIQAYPSSTSLPRVQELLKASEAFSMNK